VLDRTDPAAVAQVLQRRWDRTFSDHSYGFRPGRSLIKRWQQAQQYIAKLRLVVDLDLEKFFDRVQTRKLMGQIAKHWIERQGLLKLIRAFLNGRVMGDALVSPERGRDSARGTNFALLSNSCSTNSTGVGAPGHRLRSLCGRL